MVDRLLEISTSGASPACLCSALHCVQSPPRYQFARENNVPLIDEYDQVSEDVEPFYAMSPAFYRLNADMAAQQDFTWTWEITKGRLNSTPSKDFAPLIGNHAKALDVEQLFVKPFLHLLPDMSITMTMHDGPRQKPTWRLKQRLLEHAAQGKCESLGDS